jgi:GNAT superfamily N-acetyltransferase
MEISTDSGRIDRDLVHRFLSEDSYWAQGRTREQSDRIIDRSLCFGAYDHAGAQIGHARVITDTLTFAYVADVFVSPEARGRGVGKALVAALLAHPDVRDAKHVTLATQDAHGLYEGFGFEPIDAHRWMLRLRGD